MSSQLESLIEEYEGKPLHLGALGTFDQTVLNFFVNNDYVDDPFVDASLTHDISAAAKNFESLKNTHPKASFTAFLLWCAAKSLLEIRPLSWRFLNGTWYELQNPPFFMPIQTGNPEARLTATILKNIKYASFGDFVAQYHSVINEARTNANSALCDANTYLLAHHLVNLPSLRFTSLKPQTGRIKSTHVSWAFGQRHEESGAVKAPMMIRMHHANGDPLILDMLLRVFSAKIAGGF